MANSKSLDSADVNIVELSDSTTMPEGNAALSLGGSSSSSSAEQSASLSSLSERRRRSKCRCASADSAEQLGSEPLPCERGWDNCACCKKRKFDNDWYLDLLEGCKDKILEAIGEFQDFYKAMEFVKKLWKNPNNDVVEMVAEMNEEMEERLQKFVVEQQVVMAKMNEKKEERLEKFVVEQQVVMAKMIEEKEERLQKIMAEQQVVMAKIFADAVKDAVGRRLDSPAE